MMTVGPPRPIFRTAPTLLLVVEDEAADEDNEAEDDELGTVPSMLVGSGREYKKRTKEEMRSDAFSGY